MAHRAIRAYSIQVNRYQQQLVTINTLQFGNDRVAMELAPDFGARVISLIDRRTGRDWLVTGACVGEQDDAAVFGGPNACGWDECFPTVAPCPAAEWGGNLRDHGDMWGRPWHVTSTNDKLHAEYRNSMFSFCRELQLDGASVVASYQVENLSPHPLPYLWSQHLLLAAQADETITLSGIEDLAGADGNLPWPVTPEGHDNSLVQGIEAGFAHKAYGRCVGTATAGLSSTQGNIRLIWEAAAVPFFGLWRCWGGWPADAAVHQLALEPTTGPVDHLADAQADGSVRSLAPGNIQQWSIIIELSTA